MQAATPSTPSTPPTPPKSASLWKAALSEPLLHFIVLGGLIFAADRAAVSRQDDPRVIVIGPEVEREARSIFRSAQGRDPSPAELEVLRRRWIDNEVLYREGLSLRLEQGDAALRERVIFKTLNMINSNLQLPNIDDAGLRAWFEQRRAHYDLPARFDFDEAVLSGDTSEAAARRFAEVLNTGANAEIESGLRVFKQRPRDTIEESFGAAFAEALDRLPLATWHVLQSKDGARVVRLEAKTAGETVQFESVRARVKQDWQDEKAQQLRTTAVRELGKKYTVRIAGTES
jgi:PPIC-type PPIASE domain